MKTPAVSISFFMLCIENNKALMEKAKKNLPKVVGELLFPKKKFQTTDGAMVDPVDVMTNAWALNKPL